MVSTFTPNVAIEKVGSGDDVGVWDVPTNANWGVADSKLGTIQSINLAAGSVVLSTAQARSAFLIFTGTLPGNVTVTIPGLSSDPGTTISGGTYTIQNQCPNAMAFTVTIATTVAGQEAVCCPPMEAFDVIIEGSGSSQAGSIKFRNFGRIGSYWDYAGSSVPAWVTGCTKPPYLNCDASAFSSATYPILATILGGTTLPDARGRYRATLNQGTARITAGASTGGVDGNTLLASGGVETVTLSSQNMPPVLITDPGHFHADGEVRSLQTGTGTGPFNFKLAAGGGGSTSATASKVTAITAGNASPTNFSNLPPSYVGGITMIRSA